jgi:RHS repeat-associated protein
VAPNKYLYNGKQLQDDKFGGISLGIYDYGARMYDPQIARWNGVDPNCEGEGQESWTPYHYVLNNPIKNTDPDGRTPITGLIGAGIGALVGGGIEAGMQLYEHGEIKDWKAVGGSAIQGGITGGMAGLTGGASLLVTVGSGAAANVVGGATNNLIQGKANTLNSMAKDAAIGAGGAVLGKVAGKGLDKLSNAVKGKIGEAATQAKYLMKGYVSEAKMAVETGAKTATGRVQTAIYDHKMVNKLTGKILTVESKFNGAKLTPNQAAAASKVQTAGGLIVDRTTSGQLGNTAGGVAAGSTSSQMNKEKR